MQQSSCKNLAVGAICHVWLAHECPILAPHAGLIECYTNAYGTHVWKIAGNTVGTFKSVQNDGYPSAPLNPTKPNETVQYVFLLIAWKIIEESERRSYARCCAAFMWELVRGLKFTPLLPLYSDIWGIPLHCVALTRRFPHVFHRLPLRWWAYHHPPQLFPSCVAWFNLSCVL